jgi:membrane-bound lytic murein transglycosylase A
MPESVHFFLLGVLCSALISGCARPRTVAPEAAFRESAITSEPLSDDLNFDGLVGAIQRQRKVLRASPSKIMKFGPWQISQGQYSDALDKLATILASSESTESKLNYVRDNFQFLEWYGGTSWSNILVTGYFEPIIPGSSKPTKEFSQPLYGRPQDLITVDLKQFSPRFKDEPSLRARVHETKVLPYYSRNEIDAKGALKNRGLELCWVNPVDAFFLQIQGSGTVRMPDGSEIHLTYAEKNGHRYEPIGKFLKERLAPAPVTMQKIEEVAHAMSSAERSDLFDKNPSYVFFQRSKERATTALGIPATPGRTIASDPKYAPRGSLAFINLITAIIPATTTSNSTPIPLAVSRFVLNQDVGGAITGTDHIDLFWGRGDDAKKVAGVLQNRARIIFLLPK